MTKNFGFYLLAVICFAVLFGIIYHFCGFEVVVMAALATIAGKQIKNDAQ